jgi:hypothetical protein
MKPEDKNRVEVAPESNGSGGEKRYSKTWLYMLKNKDSGKGYIDMQAVLK